MSVRSCGQLALLVWAVRLVVGENQPVLPDRFVYLDYGAIVRTLHELSESFPGQVQLHNAQDEFGIPSPGSCGAAGACKQWYIRITNQATLQSAAGSRPQVFFSGCLHGNERIGPTTVCVLAVRAC